MGFDIGIIVSFAVMLIASLVEKYADHWLVTLIKFIVPIIGLIITVMRLKKFKTYRLNFDNSDWTQDTGGSFYVLGVKQSQHKKGKNPTVEIFEEKNGQYEKIIVDYSISQDGDLTLKPNTPFNGKVSIA